MTRRRKSALSRLLCAILTATSISLSALAADPPGNGASANDSSDKSLAQQVQELRNQYQQTQQAAFQAYQNAATNEEKQKVYSEKAPKPAEYLEKLLDLSKKDPKSPGAFEAITFGAQIAARGSGQGTSERAGELIDLVGQAQMDNPQLAQVFSLFQYTPSHPAERLMRAAAEKSPHADVRGAALFSLAQYLRRQSQMAEQLKQHPEYESMFEKSFGKETAEALAKADPGKMKDEAVALLEKVQKDYPDAKMLNRPVAEQAKGVLFALQHLDIGQEAPNIKGKDQEGKDLKLADYRGKVVVLDFWGDW